MIFKSVKTQKVNENFGCIYFKSEKDELEQKDKKYVQKAKEFEIIYKYLFNRVDFDKFKTCMERGLGRELDDSYLKEKWDEFIRNVASFAVSYKSFLIEALKEMEKENYKG